MTIKDEFCEGEPCTADEMTKFFGLDTPEGQLAMRDEKIRDLECQVSLMCSRYDNLHQMVRIMILGADVRERGLTDLREACKEPWDGEI